MISNDLLQAIQRGNATFDQVRAEFPNVSAEERKVLAFEARVEAMRSGFLGLGEFIRKHITPVKFENMAWLNAITRDEALGKTARNLRIVSGSDAESRYLVDSISGTISVLAVNEAKREIFEAERTRRQAEVRPLQRLAHEMREQVEKARQAEANAAAVARGPREKTNSEMAAQARIDNGAAAYDHLPSPLNQQMLKERQQAAGFGRDPISPAQVRAPSGAAVTVGKKSSTGWLEKLQAKAYGEDNGK